MVIQNAAPVLKKLAEPQRGVGRHGFLFARNAYDPRARHLQRRRDRVRGAA